MTVFSNFLKTCTVIVASESRCAFVREIAYVIVAEILAVSDVFIQCCLTKLTDAYSTHIPTLRQSDLEAQLTATIFSRALACYFSYMTTSWSTTAIDDWSTVVAPVHISPNVKFEHHLTAVGGNDKV